MRYKKLVTYTESHASAVSLLESGEQRYIKAIIIIIIIIIIINIIIIYSGMGTPGSKAFARYNGSAFQIVFYM